MKQMVSSFSNRLQEAMKLRHMSAAELSRRTGVSESALSHYKKGDFEAASRNLEEIANVLDVSIPWLMGYDVPMKETSHDDFRQEMFDEERVLFDYKHLSESSKETVRNIIKALKSQDENQKSNDD